jgi:hypothetical protein
MGAGIPDGTYFTMRRGVVSGDDAVPACADDMSVLDNDGTEWPAVSPFNSAPGQFESPAHENRVFFVTARRH